MQALLAERYPDAEFVEIGVKPLSNDMDFGATDIVLLYPDAIGLGFTPIEQQIRRKAPAAAVEILNGRRRQFTLDQKSRVGLRLRRFLEWTMLAELAAGLVIVAATPILLLIDFVRARR